VTDRVLVAGGGTGGHVFPALATAAALRAARPGLEVEFVGTRRGLESHLVPAAGWSLHLVAAAPLSRRPSPALLRLPVVLVRSARDVAALIRDRGVGAALCFGGYTAVPLALAARRTGIPLIVHEQNAVPGIANRLAARWAHTVAVSVPQARERLGGRGGRRRVVDTGNPVRADLAGIDRAARRFEATAAFGLDPARRTLLVFGGSQGARRINDAAVGSAGRWTDPGGLQILHAAGRPTGERTARAWEEALAAAPGPLVRCVEFLDRMDLAYAAADVVLCRAGASTIAELTALGLPSVLVPFPHATADHQTGNAHAMASAAAAVVVADADLDAATLVAACEPLLRDPGRRRTMAAAAAALGRPDAAEAVARLVLQALDGAAGRATAAPLDDNGSRR